MKFRVTARDGPARIGQLTYKNQAVTTPNIFFLDTSRCTAPPFADILLIDTMGTTNKPTVHIGDSIFSSFHEKTQKTVCVDEYLFYPKDVPLGLHRSTVARKAQAECCIVPAKKELLSELVQNNDADLFIIAHATQLFSQQSAFVDFIIELRQKIGYQKLIYLPSVGDPTSLAFLSYLGIDFFDSFAAHMAARNETFLFPTGFFKKTELPELPCSCPSCIHTHDATTMVYKEILQHNYTMLDHEIKLVRNAITAGSLRELVESRVRVHPHLASLLRILDLRHYRYLEERTPLVRKQPLLATTKDSLVRPEIRRFQERVLHRFEKPASTHVLLLLPCSAKKPYSFSKSHKLYRACFQNLPNHAIIHEVIITSPLGLVPRELELTYPASTYDTVVTGHWDEDERKMIRTLLQQYLEKNLYDYTILHVPPEIEAFIHDLFHTPHITCRDSPTSDESLAVLSNELKEATKHFAVVAPRQRAYENMRSLACYQFSPDLADLLMKDCTVCGKYPYQKIMHKTTQLGMLTEERGLISLTMDGAKRLMNSGQYHVDIHDDFILKGSVFAPGILNADEKIRIGEEVLVIRRKQLSGVGVALMNGIEMSTSSQGEAVKMRHHL
ncbi:MAG: DUF5591 domain-containing protein [Candidatus Thermoplasmatota archaeon]|nr:DUF5591 domain-containing protein [Candidatus Thermoplasmatota archaeon]